MESEQKVTLNNDWQILTPSGWSDFDGITKSSKSLRLLYINDIPIWASDDHIFYQNGQPFCVRDLSSESLIDTKGSMVSCVKTDQVQNMDSFDVFNVQNHDHTYLINDDVITHNCDEIGFVNDKIAQEFWTSIQPTLATGGDCIVSSTPNGDDNLFAELWRGAQSNNNGFKPIFIDWQRPPGRDDAFRKMMEGKIGKLKFEQEFECKFFTSDTTLIDQLYLENLKLKVSQAKTSPLMINDYPITMFSPVGVGKTYCVCVDPSTGSDADFSVIEVYEFPMLRQVCEFRSNTIKTPQLYSMLKAILRYFENRNTNQVYFTFENNGIGEGLIALFQQDPHPPSSELISETGSKRLGFTTNKNKFQTCTKFKDLVENGRFEFRSLEILRELKAFVKKGASFQAQSGSTDDCVTATLLIVRMLEVLASFDDRAHDVLFNTNDQLEWDISKSLNKPKTQNEDDGEVEAFNVIA